MRKTKIDWQNEYQVREEIKNFVSNLRNEFINQKKENPNINEYEYIIESIDSCYLYLYC